MKQRVLHHVTGRLSLRPPQSESLARLVRGLNVLPKVLSQGRHGDPTRLVGSWLDGKPVPAYRVNSKHGLPRCCGIFPNSILVVASRKSTGLDAWADDLMLGDAL